MKGQVALIVLLVSAVVMTVGLSMSEKAVVETKIDTDEELLKQAFNAAESGIDYYLGTGEVDYSASDGSSAEVEAEDFGEGETVNFGEFVNENDSALFWLVGHDGGDDIDFGDYYEGDSVDIGVGGDFAGAVKVDYYYLDGGEYKVKRFGFNYEDDRIANFTNGGGATVDTSLGTPLLLAVMPIFEGTEFTFDGSGGFPSQGEEIRAVGKVADDSMGGVSQTVKVYERYKVPLFMLEVITAVDDSVLSN